MKASCAGSPSLQYTLFHIWTLCLSLRDCRHLIKSYSKLIQHMADHLSSKPTLSHWSVVVTHSNQLLKYYNHANHFFSHYFHFQSLSINHFQFIFQLTFLLDTIKQLSILAILIWVYWLTFNWLLIHTCYSTFP